ncbi:MAG: transporter ATP-binding protein [Modestobacter sp.]|nr:transporter ATP-binding protein [Modestobacter sp.]
MTDTRTPALEVRDLSISYGETTVVQNVGFRVAPGEIVGVIGESGSGKSTVAMAAMGLLPPAARNESGQISLAGMPMTGLSEKEMCRVRGARAAMVFQEPMSALNPCMTIEAQIAEVLTIHGLSGKAAARRRALELLRLVHMPDPELKRKQFPHQLSGGQRQRVMMAMAVAASPELLVADEPTTALDVTVQAQILDLILELRQDIGLGVLFISHDLGVIAQVCDRVLVMYRGQVMEEGTPDQVLHHPQHPYTAALLASIPRASQRPRTPLTVIGGTFRVGDRLSPGDPAGGGANGPAAGPEPASAEPDRPVLLEATQLVKSFKLGRRRTLRALDDVSLAIRQGETYGVVGESGSGKSTLAKVMMLLARPDTGTIQYRGSRVDPGGTRRDIEDYRRNVQMVFQDPNDSLDPRYTILRTVAEPLRAVGLGTEETRHRVERSLAAVGFDAEVLSRYPHEFSGGQKQRIAIARAMVTEPSFVVLDEPTSALDVSVQAQILNLLLEIQQRTNVTYMFISHNLAVVRHLSHRMAVMHHGAVVEEGVAEEVFRSPQHPYTQRLLASLPELERSAEAS